MDIRFNTREHTTMTDIVTNEASKSEASSKPLEELARALSSTTTLDEARAMRVQAGLTEFQELMQRASSLQTQNQELQLQLDQAHNTIGSLREQAASQNEQAAKMQSNYEAITLTARAERDQAVADRAYLEAVFETVRRALDTADMPEPVRAAARAKRRNGNGAPRTDAAPPAEAPAAEQPQTGGT